MVKIMDVRNSLSKEPGGFWEAYLGCAEENSNEDFGTALFSQYC